MAVGIWQAYEHFPHWSTGLNPKPLALQPAASPFCDQLHEVSTHQHRNDLENGRGTSYECYEATGWASLAIRHQPPWAAAASLHGLSVHIRLFICHTTDVQDLHRLSKTQARRQRSNEFSNPEHIPSRHPSDVVATDEDFPQVAAEAAVHLGKASALLLRRRPTPQYSASESSTPNCSGQRQLQVHVLVDRPALATVLARLRPSHDLLSGPIFGGSLSSTVTAPHESKSPLW